jgi:hypothetical protein
MANKNIYEVLDEFKTAKTKQDRIGVLRKNDTWALKSVLQGVFHPDVKFNVKIPEYKKEDVPPGMSYDHMTSALQRAYLFQEGNPRTPPALTEKRKIELLIQILESLEPKEAEVFANMLKKDLKTPYLTEALVNEAFDGLLPKS